MTLHRVFINSDYSADQLSSDFRFYVTPSLTNITRVKVNSVSIPMSQYMFTDVPESERIFEAYIDAGDHRKASVTFQNDRNYTRSEFAKEISDAFKKASINVKVESDTWSGSAITFNSYETSTVIISKFPRQTTFTLPQDLSPARGTLYKDPTLQHDTQIYRTFPHVSKVDHISFENNEYSTNTLTLSAATYTDSSLYSEINFAWGSVATWTLVSGELKATYAASTSERKIQMVVYDENGKVTTTSYLNISAPNHTIHAGGQQVAVFSTSLVATNHAVFPSDYSQAAMPTINLSSHTVYTCATLVAALNTGFGSTVASVISTNVYRITNPSSTFKMLLKQNEELGIGGDTEIAPSGTHDFTVLHWINVGETFTTGPLDFGSRVSKVCYLAIPNIITTSRCGFGHQSIATSVLNQGSSSYGAYSHRTDDSTSYHLTNKKDIDEIHVQILNEKHQTADLGSLPVFVELEFV